MKKTYLFVGFAFCMIHFIMSSCNSPYTSKKTAYFKIDFPKREYRKFDKDGVPYSFEYPAYANIVKDTTYFDPSPENDFWYNVDFPQFGGRIFLSYKEIGGHSVYKIKQSNGTYKDSSGINSFDKMVNDAFKLTYKNDFVAADIAEKKIATPNGVHGIFFSLKGNVATAKQFFLSDTVHNFLRGALYFDVTPNADSLRPVQDFIQADMDHLINSFKWKTK
ncbi:MAG: hypothetical protein ABJA78_11065 [Ferruginibacter sp.]